MLKQLMLSKKLETERSKLAEVEAEETALETRSAEIESALVSPPE